MHEVLYHALSNPIPEEVPMAADSPVVLAVEDPRIADVRRQVAGQEALARFWVADD